ncbi:MAG: homoserine O-succinyltransferase [Lentisphaerae bacterium]|nr:homoserine O-succinyltransferase [Lentisphaerota bacterium]
MTIVVGAKHPVRRALQANGVDCITARDARHQDIRPLRVGILNIMPEAEKYEFNLLFPLGRSILQIIPVWIRLKTHAYRSSGRQHLGRYYVPFDQAVSEGRLDGLIVTGAPVEELPYAEVRYWEEVCSILKAARQNVASTLGICWGGLALAKFIGIDKFTYTRKVFGLYATRNLVPGHPITGGMDDVFLSPQSRHAGIQDAALEAAARRGKVRLLAHSGDAGYTIFETRDHRFVMHLGHHEYNARRLIAEYERDFLKGRKDVAPPKGLDLRNPDNCWRANRNEFFGAWIRYVYLNTTYP